MPDEKMLDAGLMYDGKYGRTQSFIEGVCNAAVHDGFGVGHHRCGRKAKVTRDVLWHGKPHRLEYCGIHDPVKVAERRAKLNRIADEKYQARRAKWAAETRIKTLGPVAIDALKEIARGHNDPRTLAMDILRDHKEEW